MRSVTHNPAQSRYEIAEDGVRLGLVAYQELDGRIVFTHTETEPARAGQGLAGELVSAALDDARRRELGVIPSCPYVRAFIARHPDRYLDLVPEGERARFDLDRPSGS